MSGKRFPCLAQELSVLVVQTFTVGVILGLFVVLELVKGLAILLKGVCLRKGTQTDQQCGNQEKGFSHSRMKC